MSLILHAVERLGIDLDSEESEYDAYVFYQVNWEARLNIMPWQPYNTKFQTPAMKSHSKFAKYVMK